VPEVWAVTIATDFKGKTDQYIILAADEGQLQVVKSSGRI